MSLLMRFTALFDLKTLRVESLTFPPVCFSNWRQKGKSRLGARKLPDDAGRGGSWIGPLRFSGVPRAMEKDWWWTLASLRPSLCVLDYNRNKCAFFPRQPCRGARGATMCFLCATLRRLDPQVGSHFPVPARAFFEISHEAPSKAVQRLSVRSRSAWACPNDLRCRRHGYLSGL